jgi:hypothetical protein
VSKSTGRWSELRAEYEVRYSGDVRFLVITMFMASGVAKELYGLVDGVSGPKIRQKFQSAYHAGLFPVLCSAASSIPCVWH